MPEEEEEDSSPSQGQSKLTSVQRSKLSLFSPLTTESEKQSVRPEIDREKKTNKRPFLSNYTHTSTHKYEGINFLIVASNSLKPRDREKEEASLVFVLIAIGI